jgi:radical SAM superfamily enzyme YgiQ (UPF0313 family)
VRIIDARLEPDAIGRTVAECADALCLGIGVLTGDPIRDALKASRAVREANTELPIVWGGWHPSLFPEECLDEPSVTACVSGQGEQTFREMVERFAAGRDLAGVEGVTWRERGKVTRNSPRPTLDPVYFPPHNYDLIDVEAYFKRKKKRQFDYISSVGCRFRCAFCADPFVYNRAWYGLPAERMVAELAELWRRYRFEEVTFQDETFFTRRERVEEISNAILAANLRFAWTGTMRADQGHRLPDETLALAKRSGLRRVMVGVEAGTDDMLKRIKKDITVAQVFSTAGKLVRNRIGAIWNFIVGFPDEPRESFEATLGIAKRLMSLSPDFEAAIFFYKPYPGNEIADQLGAGRYEFPCTLDGWADFDYVGSAGPWVTPEKYARVERFKFYLKHAYGQSRHPLARPLGAIARWRVERDFYTFPVEKTLVETFRPAPRLS